MRRCPAGRTSISRPRETSDGWAAATLPLSASLVRTLADDASALVRTTLLSSFVAQSLQQAEAVCGAQAMQALIAKADPNVFQALSRDVFGRS